MDYSQVRALPWQKQLEYYAKDGALYAKELERVDTVLSQNPENPNAKYWKSQVVAAWDGENLDNVINGNFDATKYKAPPTSVQNVGATDYLGTKGGSMGLPYNVGWADGKVTIGGIASITPSRISSDSKAYVDKADADRALGQVADELGIKTGKQLLDENNNKYGNEYSKLLDKMANRDSFSYDPDTDDVFSAYKDEYTREGNRSMEDTIGKANSLSGGMINSNSVTSGAMAKQYWSDKLMDRVPELASEAYKRYVGDYELDQKALDSLMKVDNMQFDRSYKVNNDTIKNVQTAIDSNNKRNEDIAKSKETIEKNKIENQKLELDAYKLKLDTNQKAYENALKLLDTMGGVVTQDMADILKVAVGTPTYKAKQAVQDTIDAINLEKLKAENRQKELIMQLEQKAAAAKSASSGSSSKSGNSEQGGGSGTKKTSTSSTTKSGTSEQEARNFRMPDGDLSLDEARNIVYDTDRGAGINSIQYNAMVNKATEMLNGYQDMYKMRTEPTDLKYMGRRANVADFLIESSLSQRQLMDAFKFFGLDERDVKIYNRQISDRMMGLIRSSDNSGGQE